ncbi:MAG: hypothetical protein H8D45_14605 [Bacteroidetes bacterium]|nr:hypothetical protein [Bacteroidota bacterium]MBL7105813.1 hypothetical protein [Bacteroidales bacterium]
MAQTPDKPNGTVYQPENKPGTKRWKILAILVLIVIVALLIWFIPKMNNYNKMLKEKDIQRTILQYELKDLMAAHDSVKMEYGTLSDSLAIKDSIIKANAKEIQQLLNYKWEYRKVNKKLGLLRKITQGYVHQMDSLFTVNRELKEENEKIRQQFSREQNITRELTIEKEELIDKVTQAAVLKAYNVSAKGIRYTGSGRERETDKAKKIERVKVCFSLGENNLIEPGIKIIYIRIVRPDKVVVTQKIGGAYTFEYQGKQMEYTSKKEINYQNTEANICLFWTKKSKEDPAMVGTYNVTVYADNFEIGKTSFDLK